LEYPDLKRAVKSQAKKWKPHAILIEDKGSGENLIQDLRRETQLPVIPCLPESDKITRLAAQAAKVEAGLLFIPENAQWLVDYEVELVNFPNAPHDEVPDTLSQFLKWIGDREGGEVPYPQVVMGVFSRLLGREKKSASALAPGYTLYLSGGHVVALNSYHIHTIIQHCSHVAPLNTAITKIAQAVGSLPYALKNKSTSELVTAHPVLDRLNRPNQEHQKTKRKFFEALVTWKLLEGNCYIAATGRINQPPLDLYVLNPRFIQVIPDNTGYPGEYRYQG
jgi:predicted phage terminase large subunit-like protein